MLKALALSAPVVVLVGVLLLHRLEVWTLRGSNGPARRKPDVRQRTGR